MFEKKKSLVKEKKKHKGEKDFKASKTKTLSSAHMNEKDHNQSRVSTVHGKSSEALMMLRQIYTS